MAFIAWVALFQLSPSGLSYSFTYSFAIEYRLNLRVMRDVCSRRAWKGNIMYEKDILGLSRHIGDKHHRAYIGPPDEYDLVSAMSFNLLTASGLRQHHRLLDIGCGSLRLGRLLIPYLNAENYIGLEPNEWLVQDGLRYELGDSLVALRKPLFLFDTRLDDLESGVRFDYAIAQSIFSHTAPDLLERWISDVSHRLLDTGVLFATVIEGASPCGGSGWVYPECVEYPLAVVEELARRYGLSFKTLDWFHPRQTWCAFYKPSYNVGLLDGGAPSWNRFGRLREEGAG